MTQFRVSYVADFEADTPLEAARLLAAQLARPGAPERGSYEVDNLDDHTKHDVDLDLPHNGGAGYFS